jgi:CcmD family protein
MTYLVAAYIAFWCLLFLYLFSLKARQRDLEHTVDGLMKKLEQGKP